MLLTEKCFTLKSSAIKWLMQTNYAKLQELNKIRLLNRKCPNIYHKSSYFKSKPASVPTAFQESSPPSTCRLIETERHAEIQIVINFQLTQNHKKSSKFSSGFHRREAAFCQDTSQTVVIGLSPSTFSAVTTSDGLKVGRSR